MATNPAALDAFLDLSSELTGCSRYELLGTGQAEPYLDTVVRVVGEETASELLDAHRRVADSDGDDRDALVRREILSSAKLGPIARSIVKMWFVGTWYQLPPEWADDFGTREEDTTHVVSADAYVQGLLWPSVGANPAGAKAPGYGTWTGPPRIAVDLLPRGRSS